MQKIKAEEKLCPFGGIVDSKTCQTDKCMAWADTTDYDVVNVEKEKNVGILEANGYTKIEQNEFGTIMRCEAQEKDKKGYCERLNYER